MKKVTTYPTSMEWAKVPPPFPGHPKVKTSRLTAAQKAEKLQQAEAATRAQELMDLKLLRLEMPALLYDLQELASKAKVSTEVELTPAGVELKFFFESYGSPEVLNSVTSERWNFDSVRSVLEAKVQKHEAHEAQRLLAQNAMSKFTPEEVLALKEFPQYLQKQYLQAQ